MWKWAGICGELGADLELTNAFMEMGVDELFRSSVHGAESPQKHPGI